MVQDEVGGGEPGKRLRPGQPAGSVEPPEWAGEAPTCDHGQKRKYKSQQKKNGELGHLWECTAAEYPDPAQCDAVWINPPTKGKK
ncbi:hypothetical protein ACWEF6_01745 [Amycolatopsis sp. NPDC004772]